MSNLTLDHFLCPHHRHHLAVGGDDDAAAAMMIQVAGGGGAPPLLLPESSSGGEEHEVKAPKKRAETWVQDETLSLISFRREMDSMFNTSKSNKHLWEQISARMRDKGFDRSPTMCTDKWRNLLKEFKKARSQARSGGGGGNGGGSAKMAYYKEIDELLKRRGKGGGAAKCSSTSKIDSYMQFADKGFEDANMPFGPVEATGRSMLSVEGRLEHDRLEGRLEHDRHPLAITAADAVATNGVNPWNWRDTSTNVGDNQGPFGGRVILVKWGDYTKRIGIDGTAEAIKEAIKSAFGLRTKRAFWLEDEDEVVRSFDRDMPVGTYTLHLDDGIMIKICTYDETDRMRVRTEEKTFYTEEDFRDFLSRRGWTVLREYGGYRIVDTLDDLRPGTIYQGLRSLVD